MNDSFLRSDVFWHDVFLWVDESGDLGFGTETFVLVVVKIRKDSLLFKALEDYRWDLIRREFVGEDFYFHCRKENKYIRLKVFEVISNYIGDLCIGYLAVKKRESDIFRCKNPHRSYSTMMRYGLD